MAYKQLFVIVMLVAFVSLAAAQSGGGACGAHTVPNKSNGCATPCPATCANQNTNGKICSTLCITTGCSCANGFVRRADSNSPCIRPSQCPVKN